MVFHVIIQKFNVGLADDKSGVGNGNCNGKHSDNFCSGYHNGWQDAYRVDNNTNHIKSLK